MSSTKRGTGGGRRSSTASPKPSAGTGTPNARATPTAVPAAPSRDLSTMLNLPVRVDLVSGTSVEGTLWTYDPSLSLVVVASPSAGPAESSKATYNLFKTTQVASIQVLASAPATLLAPLPLVDTKFVQQRLANAVQQDAKKRARLGQGVSPLAQDLFDALSRTLPVRWHETSIIVMDEIMVSAPYNVEDVKGRKGASSERVDRVKKVLEGERRRMAERAAS